MLFYFHQFLHSFAQNVDDADFLEIFKRMLNQSLLANLNIGFAI